MLSRRFARAYFYFHLMRMGELILSVSTFFFFFCVHVCSVLNPCFVLDFSHYIMQKAEYPT